MIIYTYVQSSHLESITFYHEREEIVSNIQCYIMLNAVR